MPSSLAPSLHVKWGLCAINHPQKADMRPPLGSLYSETMVVHPEPRETWWCDLRFLLSPLHPSLLLSHTLTMGLRPETLPPSSVPLLREHSFCQCRPCPVYEVIIGYHIPDHPRWAFNNPGFDAIRNLLRVQQPTGQRKKKIFKINYNKASFTVLVLEPLGPRGMSV